MFEMSVHYDVQETRAIAREEGLREGIREGKLEIVKTMLANNLSLDQISLFTKLGKEELQKLIKEMK